MKAVEFVGQTRLIGPPAGFNDKNPSLRCGALPILEAKVGDVTITQSFWRPTEDELRALNAGGHVCMTVAGQPAAHLSVVEGLEELP